MNSIQKSRKQRILENKRQEHQRRKTKIAGITLAATLTATTTLQVGQKVVHANNGTYTVQEGDTLYKIANNYRITVNELKKQNKLTSDSIKIGQKMNVPMESHDPNENPFKHVLYVVVSYGDTLSSIAQKYKVSVQAIKKANGLTSDNIYVGQKLKIPTTNNVEQPVSYYYVKSGDTLYYVAQKFKVSVEALKKVNGLTSEYLFVGQKLKIPTTNTEQSGSYYYVKTGDTLYDIAQKFKVSVEALKKVNGLKCDYIYIGQKLKIPTTKVEQPISFYYVKTGDTLSIIAQKFKVSVEALKKVNRLTSDTIFVGQKLKIPTTTVKQSVYYYNVEAGDTLKGIAERFHVSASDIKKLNKLQNDMVLIGQKLIISNDISKQKGVIVGASDNFTIEFQTDKGSIPLKVAYGTAQSYQNLSGKEVTIAYRNNALICMN